MVTNIESIDYTPILLCVFLFSLVLLIVVELKAESLKSSGKSSELRGMRPAIRTSYIIMGVSTIALVLYLIIL